MMAANRVTYPPRFPGTLINGLIAFLVPDFGEAEANLTHVNIFMEHEHPYPICSVTDKRISKISKYGTVQYSGSVSEDQ